MLTQRVYLFPHPTEGVWWYELFTILGEGPTRHPTNYPLKRLTSNFFYTVNGEGAIQPYTHKGRKPLPDEIFLFLEEDYDPREAHEGVRQMFPDTSVGVCMTFIEEEAVHAAQEG